MPFPHVLPLLRLLILALAGAGHATAPYAPALTRERDCQVWIEPRAYRPGDVLVALGRCETPPTTVRARFAGADVAFFPVAEARADAGANRGEQTDVARPRAFGALLGIDVAMSPGTHELTWEAQFPGGDARGSGVVSVERRDFPAQRLRLPKRFVQPDSAAQVRIRAERERLAAILSVRTPERLWQGAFASPLPDARGAGFGARRILNGVPSEPHAGIDLPAPTGEPVHAPNDGRVALVDALYYAGNTVVLDHGLGLFTIYSHLSQTSVAPGDLVRRGDLLGRVGATGRVTGPHLHWAVRVSRARVDPIALMSATAGSALEAPEPRPVEAERP